MPERVHRHQAAYPALWRAVVGAIRDELVEGVNHMTSVWEPTPNELAQLNAGGAVRLTILGSCHPPVMLTTQSAPEANDA